MRTLATVLCVVTLTCPVGGAEPNPIARSAWVFPGPDGKLVYKTTPAGDRIINFSHAGYMGGGVALPEVPARKAVQPSGGGDDTDLIQAAIDEVSALPLKDGFRGAVLLAPGIFTCTRPLTITASGVVLRGSGSGHAPDAPKTTIKLAGRPHLAIAIRATGAGRQPTPPPDAAAQPAAVAEPSAPIITTTIADAYVPSGASSFTVADATRFAVGDMIAIRRPVTEAWVKFMEMHDLTRNERPQTWMRAGTITSTERCIAAIAENRITLDVPLSDSFDAKFLTPPGTFVEKLPPSTRVTQCGLEYLHIESPLQEISHNQPHFTAVRMNGEDCWMRDVVIDETMDSISTGGRRITLERVVVNRKAKHQGASKPAEFAPNASQVLMDRCVVDADNVWFIGTGNGVAGPIVALNCTFIGNGRSEAHQRWSTGMLYDNCRALDGGFEMRNRGSMGSGHGWSMGWGVVWNCDAKIFLIQNPPGAMNWLIGSVGESRKSARPFGAEPLLPGATEDSHGVRVSPQSLYLTQLAERLGPKSVKNLGYASTDVNSAPQSRFASAPRRPEPTLGVNLALDRPVLTTNTRGGEREFAGWQALDNDDKTYWATDDGTTTARLELDTEGSLEINAVELSEATGLTGQVKAYTVEGFVDSAWKVLCEGSAIGERKLQRFPTVTVWKVRLTISKAEPYAAIRKLGLYLEK